uniref:DUF4062 domain-containing protein n=1 Tax=Echinostoma caproni TaxID=27848 RepID=A0A183ATE6_9TREM
LCYSKFTLDTYREAIGKAISIAVRNNLPPIQGNTLIVCCFQGDGRQKKLTKQLKAAGLGKDLRAIGTLLAVMCARICQSSTTYALLNDDDRCYASLEPLSLKKCLDDFKAIDYHFDTVYVIGDMCQAVAEFVAFQRIQVAPVNAVWSNLSGTNFWTPEFGKKSDWVIMNGPTDQVLRYLAEASDRSLVDHVERIDELFGLTKPFQVHFPDKPVPDQEDAIDVQYSSYLSHFSWRCCRIFISSTFRDMHAERDLICGLVIPSLRQYAAQELRVHVLDIDLRWGVPESSTRSSQALEMCLEYASKADLLILLLGNRYGWSPKQALLNTLPDGFHQTLAKFYEPGMSITEIEYNMAKYAARSRVPPEKKRLGPDAEREALRSRVFAFTRDPASLEGIPQEHALEFDEANEVKRKRLIAFKSTLQNDGVLVLDNYPAWFNGLIANRPVMGNLTVLGSELSRTLREAVHRLYHLEHPNPLADQPMELPHRSPPISEFVRIYIEPVALAIAPRQLLDLERAANEMMERGKQCHALRLLATQGTQPSRQSLHLKETVDRTNSSASNGNRRYHLVSYLDFCPSLTESSISRSSPLSAMPIQTSHI